MPEEAMIKLWLEKQSEKIILQRFQKGLYKLHTTRDNITSKRRINDKNDTHIDLSIYKELWG